MDQRGGRDDRRGSGGGGGRDSRGGGGGGRRPPVDTAPALGERTSIETRHFVVFTMEAMGGGWSHHYCHRLIPQC